jgi:nitrogen fixation protein FixH
MNPVTDSPSDSLRWPVALALVLATGMLASLAFLWVAASQPRELIGDGAWNAGSEYNADLRAQETAQARGWTLALHAERRGAGVHVEVRPKSSGEPLPAELQVHLRRERPERSDFDADLPLARDGEVWSADVALPLAGRWLLVARAGGGDAWTERSFLLELP